MKSFKKTITSISTFALVMTATLSPNSCPISKINPVVPISASAAEVSEDGWEYDISAGEVTITGYTGEAEELSIPSTLGGFSVRRIADKAFWFNRFLKSVKIPEGVKFIGNSAFESCYNLNMISLPSSLEFIGDSAFLYTSLVDVVIPKNVTDIGSLSFSQFRTEASLKTVTIMGNTRVADDAFGYSESIESIKFNYNYRSNFTKAFKNCVNLQYINNIPILNEEEHRINTRYLDIIKNLENNKYVNEYINEYAPDKVGEEWQYEIHEGEVTITKYTGTDEELVIPSTIVGLPVRHIAYRAFYNNTSLKSVKIPEGVKSIKNEAFRSCTYLNMISLPSSLESIEENAFGYSESIESIKLYYDYRSEFTKVFKKCVNLHYINDNSITYKGANDKLCVNTRYLAIIKNLADNKYVNEYIQDNIHDKAMHIVNTVTNSSMTDVQKAKALHDWICNKVEYDTPDMWAWKNHIEESVFFYDTTVCDGYAKGYKYLLDLAGITSYFVHSDDCSNEDGITHAWNIVKLGDHYFHIDVCWDDSNHNYNWFMNPDTEVNAYGNEKEKWVALDKEGNRLETPECKFSLGDVDQSGEINEDDYQYLKNYLAKDSNYDLSEGDKVLANLDFNGVIDNHDLELLKKKVDYFYMQRLLNSGI